MDKKIKKQWETPFLPGSFKNPDKIWHSMDKKGKKDIKNRENLRKVLFGVESYLSQI
jgi:hypothetical protein